MNNTDHWQKMSIQYCFPDNNSSCRKEVRTDPAYLFIFIVLSCISVCTVFLNLLVIISISHFKQLHTPTNLLILSLAVADLLVGLIVMPVKIMELLDSCWYLGKIMCSLYPLVAFFSMSASLCSLVFISIDQYIAVSDPLLYSTRVTICKTSVFIIIGWSVCLFYVTVYLYFNDHLLQSQISPSCYGECVVVFKQSLQIVDLVISFITPCSIILVLYSLIFKVATRQARAVKAVKNTASQKHGANVSNSSQNKAAKKLGIVIFVYMTCWILFYLCSVSPESLTSVSMVWTVFGWLTLMNSTMNPLIYAICYSWFRASVKYILTCRILESSSSWTKLLPDNF
ncbi:trace amine-associated receptor 13c-like [Hoplias malabaricus]|uniref:trace amine-associated receptor 13c-like n=1 Tax=Hoplias malabaricus TaxID=27720 RepID=UPI0034623773